MTDRKSRRQASIERLEEAEALIETTHAETVERAPHVRELTVWLRMRKEENGFGRDFEYTLARPRAAK